MLIEGENPNGREKWFPVEIESGSSSVEPQAHVWKSRRRRNTLSFRVFDVVNDFVAGNYRAIKSTEDRALLVNARWDHEVSRINAFVSTCSVVNDLGRCINGFMRFKVDSGRGHPIRGQNDANLARELPQLRDDKCVDFICLDLTLGHFNGLCLCLNISF